MKNRKLTYVLVPLVLFIWGLIIFKVNKHSHHPQKPSIVINSIKNSNPGIETDSAAMILNYRDPFLGGIALSAQSREELLNQNTSFSTSLKSVLNFPLTKYSGLVTNTKNKFKVGLIKIENKEFLATEGDLLGGEKIVRLFADSVVISFKKTKKTFPKN
jgi:hypothetical protein